MEANVTYDNDFIEFLNLYEFNEEIREKFDSLLETGLYEVSILRGIILNDYKNQVEERNLSILAESFSRDVSYEYLVGCMYK